MPSAYDEIGKNYNRHRCAESSIVNELVRLLELPVGSTLADIGAGTGNYSNALAQCGFRVTAVEPSTVMRRQAESNPNVEWVTGSAEDIPLPDSSVQAIVSTLALHHFTSLEDGAREMRRICPNGPIVILTIDPRLGEPFWFSEYFSTIYSRLFSVFPPIATVRDILCGDLGYAVECVPYLLPNTALDMTMHSGWNKPEIYLDESYRQNHYCPNVRSSLLFNILILKVNNPLYACHRLELLYR